MNKSKVVRIVSTAWAQAAKQMKQWFKSWDYVSQELVKGA